MNIMNMTNRPAPTMDYTKFLTLPDSDNIRFKNIVKQKLLASKDILYLLNAAEDSFEPEDYFGTYLLPYYMIDSANAEVHNYLCYETSFTELSDKNSLYRRMHLIFYIYIHRRDMIHPQSGIARHDLISALLTRSINWSEAFGMKCRLIQDKAGAADFHYAARTLIFECLAPNAISKTNMDTGESHFCSGDPDEEWY